MPIFTFTDTYFDGNPLFAVDLDNLRDSIQDAIDTTGLDYQNIQSATLVPANFEDPGIFVQPGIVVNYVGTTAPAGWLLANGASLSIYAYPNLFATLGYTYGGSGNSFNVPNLQEYVSVGRDNLGNNGAAGRISVGVSGADPTILGNTLGNQNLPSHSHTLTGITTDANEGSHIHTYSGTHNHGSTGDRGAVSGSGTILPQGRVGGYQLIATGRALNTASTGVSLTPNSGAHTHTLASITVSSNSNTSTVINGVVQPTIILNKIIKY